MEARLTNVVPFVARLVLVNAHQSEPVPPLDTVEDAVDYVQSLGYTYLPNVPMVKQARLSKSGTEFTIAGWTQRQASKAEKKPARVVGLYLTLEIAMPRQVPLLRTKPPEAFGTSGVTLFVPHFGQSVTISRGVDLGEGATNESVVASLNRLWLDAAEYAEGQGTSLAAMSEVDWTRYRFDDRVVIDRADEVSLYRLAQSWGWQFRPKGPGGRSGGGWLIWTTIDDREVDFAEAPSDVPVPTKFIVFTSFTLPPSSNPKMWTAEKEKSYPTLQFFATGYQAGIRMSIDLSKGMTLGDLRRRIQAFADLTKDWEKGRHAP